MLFSDITANDDGYYMYPTGPVVKDFQEQSEVNVARWLECSGLVYEYEPTLFCMEGHRNFRPDFFIESLDLYLEVYGSNPLNKMVKIANVMQRWPNVRILMVSKKQANRLAHNTRAMTAHEAGAYLNEWYERQIAQNPARVWKDAAREQRAREMFPALAAA